MICLILLKEGRRHHNDGVYLSDIGINIFLVALQLGLREALSFPDVARAQAEA